MFFDYYYGDMYDIERRTREYHAKRRKEKHERQEGVKDMFNTLFNISFDRVNSNITSTVDLDLCTVKPGKISIAVPGLTKADLTVEVDEDKNQLTVLSKSKTEFVKPFTKTWDMPSNTDLNSFVVECQNGVLDISYKTKEEKPKEKKKIEVK